MVLDIRKNYDFLISRRDGSFLHLSFYSIEDARAFISEHGEELGVDVQNSLIDAPCSPEELSGFYEGKTGIRKKGRGKRKKNDHSDENSIELFDDDLV